MTLQQLSEETRQLAAMIKAITPVRRAEDLHFNCPTCGSSDVVEAMARYGSITHYCVSCEYSWTTVR